MEEHALSICEKGYIDGPVSRKHKRRVWAGYGVIALAGLLPTLLGFAMEGISWRLQVAGMGLVIPGGGFLAIGGGLGIFLFLFSAVLFVVCVALWNTTGNQLALFAVWIAADIAACTVFLREPVWGIGGSCAAAAIALAYFVRSVIQKKTKLKKQLALQKERQEFFKTEIPAQEAAALPEVPDGQFELTEQQLAQQRALFDLASGPYGEFRGFTKPGGSQVPLTALRYQLSQMLNTLQQIQCQYTPSFQGYAAQAQRDLIAMYLHPRVWNYWQMENVIGNLKCGADPIGRENVMLTGFFLLNLTMYMRNTGDLRYAQEGGLTFQDKRHCFPHTAHSLADSIVENWNSFDYVVYPCEPNWNYSLCNWKAIQSMVSYDALFGTEKWEENKRRVLDAYIREMTLPDGSAYLFKTTRTGFGVHFGAAEAFQIAMYNTVDPAMARKSFAFHRRDTFRRGEDGALALIPFPFDHGSYGKNYVDTAALALFPANEMGDAEAAQAALRLLEEKASYQEENGAVRYECSTEVNALLLQASINTRNGWRRAVVDGPAQCALTGPQLEEAPYPQVLVAKAFSHGEDLELVLYPGAGKGTQALRLGRLVPGKRYCVRENGYAFTAGQDGKAEMEVALSGRTALTIVPED